MKKKDIEELLNSKVEWVQDVNRRLARFYDKLERLSREVRRDFVNVNSDIERLLERKAPRNDFENFVETFNELVDKFDLLLEFLGVEIVTGPTLMGRKKENQCPTCGKETQSTSEKVEGS